MLTFETVASGLCFPEGPRWHDGALWFSDMHGHVVHRLERDGTLSSVAEVPECPSGLGFLPDGTPLVVSMHDRRILRIVDGHTELHADLSELTPAHCNDMFVDPQGRAYVGNFGGLEPAPAPAVPTVVVMVTPDGEARTVADRLHFPNGMVKNTSGDTFIVAESRSVPTSRLTAFTVTDDGSLTDRRTLIEFGEHELADGIAVDADDHIWVTMPFANRLVRVTPTGEIDREIEVDNPYAVAIGGQAHSELFIASSPTWLEQDAIQLRAGMILRTRI